MHINNTVGKTASEALPTLCRTVLEHGTAEHSRNGGVLELMNVSFTLSDPTQQLEITTPERNASFPAQIAETMWILAGRNDIGWLSHYLPRAKNFSDDGETWRGGYGPRIRDWRDEIDQLEYVVDLLNQDPDTRRAIINIYEPSIDSTTEPVKDVPCNDTLHFLQRGGKLHLNVFTRSNDLMWGWSGINAFEWGALLSVVAGLTGSEPGSITFNIGSLHLYQPYWDKARRISDLPGNKKDVVSVPTSFSGLHTVERLDDAIKKWFRAEELVREGSTAEEIDQAITAIGVPQFQRWARILDMWWNATPPNYAWLDTSFLKALHYSPSPKPLPSPGPDLPEPDSFTRYVADLHAEKHASYGDSWCRRGEMLGIMANLARKVDRLGVSDSAETSTDTAIDLLVYLLKYRAWLTANCDNVPLPMSLPHWDPMELTGSPEEVDDQLRFLDKNRPEKRPLSENIQYIREMFDGRLELEVEEKRAGRYITVDLLIAEAHALALSLWTQDTEQTLAQRNATRRWKGYNPEDIDAVTGD